MSWYLRVCWLEIRMTWISWMQNRSGFFMIAMGWMVSPLVSLFIWSTAASGRTIGGMAQGEVVAYYLLFILVNQITYSQTHWIVGNGIRMGSLNSVLLHPVPPVLNTIGTEIGGKGVYLLFVGPVAAVLALIMHPEMHVSLWGSLLFVPTLLLAWGLRFFWGYWLALLAFWVERADIALVVDDALLFLLAGQVAPIAFLPPSLQFWARILPFRYMVSFPVEVISGSLSLSEMVSGLLFQVGWTAVALSIFIVLWHRGVRRYSALGG